MFMKTKIDNRGSKNPNWKGGLVKRECQICGAEYFVKRSHVSKRKTCSRACGRKYVGIVNAQYAKERRIKKYCEICNKEIRVKPSHVDVEGTYCSKECMAIGYSKRLSGEDNPNWRGGKVKLYCKNCGKEFLVTPSLKDKRKFCSKSCGATWRTKNNMRDYGSRGYASGKRDDLDGRYFRSSWEANYARYLNWLIKVGEIESWEYETEEFEFPVKRGNVRYLPDFIVTNQDGTKEYHEVKGYMDNDSRVKLKRMAKYYPDIKVIVIGKDSYHAIMRQIGNLVDGIEKPRRRGRRK